MAARVRATAVALAAERALAAVVAGTLIDVSGWRAAFVIPGIVSVVTGLGYAWLCMHDGRAGTAHCWCRPCRGVVVSDGQQQIA